MAANNIISVALILEYEEASKREAARLGLAYWAVDSVIDMFCQLARASTERFKPALDQIPDTVPEPLDRLAVVWVTQSCRTLF